MLPRHARYALSHLRCNGHGLLLGSYLSRIDRIENPSCSACGHCPRTLLISFCTVQLPNLCAGHSFASLCLFTTSGQDPGELLGFWVSMVFRHTPIPWKGSGKQQQQQYVTRGHSFFICVTNLDLTPIIAGAPSVQICWKFCQLSSSASKKSPQELRHQQWLLCLTVYC